MIQTPRTYKDFVLHETDRVDYFTEVCKNPRNESQKVVVRMNPDFVDELDEVCHTHRVDRSNFIRQSLRDSIRFHREVELPYLTQK